MKKILMAVLIISIILTGCGQPTAEDVAMQSKFDVTFSQLDNDKLTASFEVAGLPNDEEFNQIPIIISDSLNAQELVSGKLYTINVYRNGQDVTVDPEYGTATFKDGALVDNGLKNITVDQYLAETDQTTK